MLHGGMQAWETYWRQQRVTCCDIKKFEVRHMEFRRSFLTAATKFPPSTLFPQSLSSTVGTSDMSFTDSIFMGPSSPPSSHLPFSMGTPSPLDTQDHFAPQGAPTLHDLSRSGSPPQPTLDSLVSAIRVQEDTVTERVSGTYTTPWGCRGHARHPLPRDIFVGGSRNRTHVREAVISG